MNEWHLTYVHSNTDESQQNNDDIVHLTEKAFTDAIKAYLTKGADVNLGDQVAPVLANQLITMSNIQNLQSMFLFMTWISRTLGWFGSSEYTAGFWSNLEHWLIQTVVDGTSPGVRSMNIEAFCRNTSVFLTEIHVKLNKLDQEKRQSMASKAVDWAKRLVQAALGSSLVFKGTIYSWIILITSLIWVIDKAGAFLHLANKLIVEYWDQFKDDEFEHVSKEDQKEYSYWQHCCFRLSLINPSSLFHCSQKAKRPL